MRGFRLSLLLFCALIVLAFSLPLLISSNGLSIDLAHDLAKATSGAPLGYAENGVDLLTALCHGARLSMSLALFCTIICVLVGALFGSASAYFAGTIDSTLSHVVDVALAFPGILLAIYIGAILGPSISNLAIALCATGWVPYARVARAQIMAGKNKDYVLAAKALGASDWRIIRVHLLPQCFGPIAVQAGFGVSGIIIGEAALSFLGIGVPIGSPSWGSLLDQGVTYLFVAPHIAFYTVACISITVFICNFFSEGLRDFLDQRTR